MLVQTMRVFTKKPYLIRTISTLEAAKYPLLTMVFCYYGLVLQLADIR